MAKKKNKGKKGGGAKKNGNGGPKDAGGAVDDIAATTTEEVEDKTEEGMWRLHKYVMQFLKFDFTESFVSYREHRGCSCDGGD